MACPSFRAEQLPFYQSLGKIHGKKKVIRKAVTRYKLWIQLPNILKSQVLDTYTDVMRYVLKIPRSGHPSVENLVGIKTSFHLSHERPALSWQGSLVRDEHYCPQGDKVDHSEEWI